MEKKILEMFEDRKEKMVKVRVVRIAKKDAYYNVRHLLLGVEGLMLVNKYPQSTWSSGGFIMDLEKWKSMSVEAKRELSRQSKYFYKVLLKRL